jgi:hypothetical protein
LETQKMKNTLISFVAVTALAVSSASAAVNFTDNFNTNTRGNYNVSVAPADVTYGAAAGISGGGGLAIAASGSGLPSVVSNAGFTVGTGDTLDMSVFIRKSAEGYDGSSQLFLGISTNSNDSWGGSVGGTFSALGIVVNAFGQIGTRRSVSGGGNDIGNFAPQAPFSLTNGNWYKLTASLTKPVSGNDWTVSGQFQDWGDGTAQGATLLTRSPTTVTIADATFNDALTTTYGEFGIRKPAWSGADNFSIVSVPEPTTMALCGIGALALAARRRRLKAS